jgi:hypothetical protein
MTDRDALRRAASASLAKAAGNDHRFPQPSESMVGAWAEAFARHAVVAEEALEAVGRHYAASTETILPANVVALVKIIRSERRDHAEPRHLPSRFEGTSRSQAATNAYGLALTRAVLNLPKEPCIDCNRPTALRLREMPRCQRHGGSVDLEAAQAAVRDNPPTRPVREGEVFDRLGTMIVRGR